MFAYTLCFIGLGLFLREARILLRPLWLSFRMDSLTLGSHREALLVFHDVDEILASGSIPPESRWEKLAGLSEPWGRLASEGMWELRRLGAPLRPTLLRIRQLVENQIDSIETGKSKVALAMAQAGVCLGLVVFLGMGLGVVLPQVREKMGAWVLVGTIAVLWVGAGGAWIVAMAQSARWGGVRKDRRFWILSLNCGVERFLAVLRTGVPPQTAYAGFIDALRLEDARLGDLVEKGRVPDSQKSPNAIEKAIVDLAKAIATGVQLSLAEGRPCEERVSAAVEQFRLSVKSAISIEVTKLSVRSLLPIFLCVVPATFGVLGFGVFLAVSEIVEK